MLTERADHYNYWLSKEPPFDVDAAVQQQAGEFVAKKLTREEQTGCNVMITAKRCAPQLWHPFQEGEQDRRRVRYFLYGLATWLGIPQFEEGLLFIGRGDNTRASMCYGVPERRSEGSASLLWSHSRGLAEQSRQELDRIVSSTRETGQWSLDDRIASAVKFAERLKQIIDCHESDYERGRKPPRYWRVNSGVVAFLEACRSRLFHGRIHQYVRAIESFLPSNAWGEGQFVKKSSILCGSDQQTREALKEMYRLRSKAEHHEHFEDARLTGSVPEETAWLRAWQAEVLCLELYRRLFTESSAFMDVYQDSDPISRFWQDDRAVRKEWGAQFRLAGLPASNPPPTWLA